MKDYIIENFRWLARNERSTGGGSTDKGLDDIEEMKAEFVLLGRELEMAAANARGKRSEKFEKDVECEEGVRAIIRRKISGNNWNDAAWPSGLALGFQPGC